METVRYRAIAEELRERIDKGVYPVGSRLPSIAALMQEFDVKGLNTIRDAQQTAVFNITGHDRDWLPERIPAGRWGRPEDIAQTAVFLAAPASDYVNGAILNVDGGWLAR